MIASNLSFVHIKLSSTSSAKPINILAKRNSITEKMVKYAPNLLTPSEANILSSFLVPNAK